MSVIHITTDNFETEVIKAEQPVLLDFWASWCGPCQMIAPIIEELGEEVKDAKICKIDVDDQPELAMKFNVMSIPTLIVMKNGEAAVTSVGLKQKSEILEMLQA